MRDDLCKAQKLSMSGKSEERRHVTHIMETINDLSVSKSEERSRREAH